MFFLNFKKTSKLYEGFTLIELLIVIAILAVLATTVTLVLNPTELIKQARDSTRLADLNNINKALTTYQTDITSNQDFGEDNTLYISLADSTTTCANHTLPSLPSGWEYNCVTEDNLKNIDGTGWIPINFTQISFGSPLATLPIDPSNTDTNGRYYTYAAGSWHITAAMESETHQDKTLTSGGNPERYEIGSDTNISPFVSTPSSKYFTTLWKTDNTGTSNDNQITIPTAGSNYDFTVYWGDGTEETYSGSPGDITHTYDTPGEYIVRITGDFPRIHFDNGGDKDKILEVQNWGDIVWGSFNYAFRGASNLDITATDVPDLSGVSDMYAMFFNASSLVGNSSFSNWNVSNVTTMGSMIRDTQFNQDISSWDVSNVTNMHAMFYSSESFNQDISGWDVGNVTDITYMFAHADSFNQDISSWDTSSVTKMHRAFQSADSFNQDISNWDVSNVWSMFDMFKNATSFNQDLSSWDVSNVTDCTDFSTGATSWTEPKPNFTNCTP